MEKALWLRGLTHSSSEDLSSVLRTHEGSSQPLVTLALGDLTPLLDSESTCTPAYVNFYIIKNKIDTSVKKKC